MIYGNIDSPKKAIKESNSGGKTKIYDYFGSKSKKESELTAVVVPNIESHWKLLFQRLLLFVNQHPMFMQLLFLIWM